MKIDYFQCPSCKEGYRFKCTACGASYPIAENKIVPSVDELRICRECGHNQLADDED